jgi:hypothetical protein
MKSIEEIIQEIETRYSSENPDAKIVKVKIINGKGWLMDKEGQIISIWNKPDRKHSEMWETNAYYVADGDMKWVGLVEESNIEFI